MFGSIVVAAIQTCTIVFLVPLFSMALSYISADIWLCFGIHTDTSKGCLSSSQCWICLWRIETQAIAKVHFKSLVSLNLPHLNYIEWQNYTKKPHKLINYFKSSLKINEMKIRIAFPFRYYTICFCFQCKVRHFLMMSYEKWKLYKTKIMNESRKENLLFS